MSAAQPTTEDLTTTVRRLEERLAEIEKVVHDGDVHARYVQAEQVTVQAPTDERPTVTLRPAADGLVVADGKGLGPQVTIGVDSGGDFCGVTGKRTPPKASVVVWADSETPGVEIDASVGHPRRSDLGEIEINSSSGTEPSIRMADGGAQFQHPAGGGRLDISTSKEWATLFLRAKDDMQAPTIGLHTDLENADERGRPAGDALIMIRHNDQDMVRAGCFGTHGRPSTGYLTVAEGIADGSMVGRDRIRLAVGKDGQAGLDLLSPSGDTLNLDAGPDGAAIVVRDGTAAAWRQWLDRDGLSDGR